MNIQPKSDKYKTYVMYGLGTSFIGGGIIALAVIVWHFFISQPNKLSSEYSNTIGLESYKIGYIGPLKYNKFNYDKDYEEWESSKWYKYALYVSAAIFFIGLIPVLIGLGGLIREDKK